MQVLQVQVSSFFFNKLNSKTKFLLIKTWAWYWWYFNKFAILLRYVKSLVVAELCRWDLLSCGDGFENVNLKEWKVKVSTKLI